MMSLYEAEMQKNAQVYGPSAIRELAHLAGSADSESVRRGAANDLIEMGHERPKSTVQELVELQAMTYNITLVMPRARGEAPEEVVVHAKPEPVHQELQDVEDAELVSSEGDPALLMIVKRPSRAAT